jgi:hypothetical protein
MKLITLATTTLTIAAVTLSAGIAAAQPGTDSNYIGVGVSAGTTSGGRGNDDAQFGGNVQGRFAIPKTPLSLRGAVLFGGDATAIMPIVTYDAPIDKGTNVYFGGGYSFVTDEGKNTPLGNQNSPVVTLGAESAVTKNVIVYGDAKWGIDAYKDSNADAVSLQAGLGYRF